jgi:heptosyltransferase-2
MIEKNKITNYQKIAIINTAFIGDVLLSIFLAQQIKNLHPNSKIYFITSSRLFELLNCVKAIDKIITYDKHTKDKGIQGFITIVQKILQEQVELILAPHRSARTSLISFFSHPVFSVSYDTSSLKFLYKKTVKYQHTLHEIERNFELLRPFDDVVFPLGLPTVDFVFPNNLPGKIAALLGESFEKQKIVAMAPGSVWKTKQWLPERFQYLGTELQKAGYKVVLIGGEDDRLLCEEIAKNSGALNIAGETSLVESLYLIKQSKLLITNDSSPTHLASLTDCPCITIYGPTIPEFGFYPRSKKSRIIQVENLKCKPCSIHGYNRCPLKHHNCMKLINEKDVLNTALELLSDKGFHIDTAYFTNSIKS